MRSHVLEGTLHHRRIRPFEYAFHHSVWYLALDVDELPGIARRLRLFARNERMPRAFRANSRRRRAIPGSSSTSSARYQTE